MNHTIVTALHLIEFGVIGAAVGFLGGLFGIGGAILIIPILSIFFGIDQQHAQGTALVMGVPVVSMGLWRYMQHPNFDKRGALILAVTATPLVYAGAWFAVNVAGRGLRPAFAIFLVLIAAWMAYVAYRRNVNPPSQSDKPAGPIWLGILGAVSGTMSGVFSAGGAAFSVPMLSTFFGYTQAAAQGMALGLIAPGAFVSLAEYGIAHSVNWPIGIALALGGTLFIKPGVTLAHRLPELHLRLLFSALLIVSALALFRTE